MSNTLLNPDALEAAYAAYAELTVEEWRKPPSSAWRERVIEDVNIAVSAYLAVAQPEVNSANFPNVTRVEIIRDGGRALTEYGTEDVFYDVQDEGRTLKVFMKVPSPDYSAYRKAPYRERNRPEVNDA